MGKLFGKDGKDASDQIPAMKDKRLGEFLENIGSRVAEYIGDDPACVMEVGSGAAFYATGLRMCLQSKHKKFDVSYSQFKKEACNIDDPESCLDLDAVMGRKVIPVDDAISTSATYHKVKAIMDRLQEDKVIMGYQMVVEHDMIGLEDVWSACINGK
jgi:hypoxanthine-guanine phosphoribosyltransferase